MNIRHSIASIMLAFAVLFSGNVAAQGINDKLNDALDAMSNYTPPSVHQGARRTIITGGSLSIKMQTGNISGFAFRPPSVSVGCGGIDAFFGAFSMISKEAITQALRGIVTGAIQYAFKLAISVICEKCATWMADIGDLLAEANNWLSDTCGATYNAMVSKWGDPADRGKNMAANSRTTSGNADDDADARSQGSAISSWTKAMQSARAGASGSGPNDSTLTEQNAVLGNHLWRVLKDKGSTIYTLGGNDTFYEEIMSLVGTVVVCGEGVGTCPAVASTAAKSKQAGEPDTRIIPYSLSLQELVSGKKGVTPSGASDVVKILRCESADKSKTGCLAPTATPDPGFRSLESRFRTAFLGNGASSGIIYKLRFSPATPMTPEEEIWMKSGGSYVGQLIKLARMDETAAIGFANDFAELIVAQMATEYIREQYTNIRLASGREQLKGMDMMFEMLMESEKRSEEAYKTYQAEAAGKTALFNAYIARIDSLRQ